MNTRASIAIAALTLICGVTIGVGASHTPYVERLTNTGQAV
jgi:hypothetical protein